MPWWGWIIFGAFLLGSELLGVDAAFYLVFVGFAAVVTGLIVLGGLAPEIWVQWLIFAVLAVTAMVLFRARLYKRFRGVATNYNAGPAGQILTLPDQLDPGETCRLNYRGTTWTALNSGKVTITKGSRAEVTDVDGTTLVVAAIENKIT